jgi:multidrug efflux pump subunit AcrA (membrane-fusion protein)
MLVPKSAVVTLGTTSRLYVLRQEHVEERIVQLGETLDADVEVRGQLLAGDRVVVRDAEKLVDGAAVDG